MSEEKFSKCEERVEKKYKCGISGVRKKKGLKGKFRRKNQSVFFGGGKFKVKIFVAVKS